MEQILSTALGAPWYGHLAPVGGGSCINAPGVDQMGSPATGYRHIGVSLVPELLQSDDIFRTILKSCP
jgi:hypothetical protein